MSGNKLLLDTNAVLDFMSDSTYKNVFDDKTLFVSVITELELMSYHELSEKELVKIKEFLEFCEIIELSPAVKSKTIELRQSHKLKLPDAIICATSSVFGLTLVTADKKLHKVEKLNIVTLDNLVLK